MAELNSFFVNRTNPSGRMRYRLNTTPRAVNLPLFRRLTLEKLESRQVLDAVPVISEFMAAGNDLLPDVDGDYPDWIEIYNPTEDAVDLGGWYLSDDAAELTKWQFPDTLLQPGGYLVAFASDKNRRIPGQELHTNFKLSSSGEYLALIQPDGITPAYEFWPQFPEQLEDVSYGITQEVTPFVAPSAEAKYLVPTSAEAGVQTQWTTTGFDDSSWVDKVETGVSPLLITEIHNSATDWVEIQNVSEATVGTSGWFLAVNDATSGDINDVNPVVWALPASIAAGEILYRTDDPDDSYFGADIAWDADRGWAMIVDDQGQVIDFLPFGYSEPEIDSLEVSVQGFQNITLTDQWIGGAPVATANDFNVDNDGVDVGDPTPAGSYAYDGTSETFSVTGGGRDVWGTSDQFYYVSQPLSGDTEAIARVTGIDNTHALAKAGLMIRETLDADSKNAAVVISAGAGVSFQRRTTTAGLTDNTTDYSKAVPLWVKLVRQGDTFLGYHSDDGDSWTLMGSVTIPMSQEVYVGLAVTSHDDGVPCTAEFQNVMVSTSTTVSTWQRAGNSDTNTASDFTAAANATPGVQNPELITPFPDAGGTPATTGLGFDVNSMGFHVTGYRSNIAVDHLATAEQVIRDPALQNSVVTERAGVINYANPVGNGHYGNDAPFPGTILGNDVDDLVIEATTTVTISDADSWTFGIRSDDGFSLELTDGTDTFTSTFADPRLPDDTLGVFNLTRPGKYQLRLVFFERTGGATLELFAARGIHNGFDPDVFRLVGDTAGGGLAATSFGGTIRTDVASQMYNLNASIWARIPFELDDPSGFDALSLRMTYNDGFAAYLNGTEIAHRNAPDTLQWNSNATAEQSYQQSSTPEEIDVSAFLDKLTAGVNVLAVQGLNVAAGDDDFLILPEFNGTRTGLVRRYFEGPTPGGPNGMGFVGFVEDTRFSVDRGFYTDPLSVSISTDTPGATIRYTTDGTAPTETSGIVYTGPITIDRTTTLRAAGLKTDYIPTNVDTQTYIFLDDVIHQSASQPGFPAIWDGIGQPPISADYEMDPDVVNNPAYRDEIIAGLQSIPTMSIVMDPEDLFGATEGIYSNSGQRGSAWERTASVEIINSDGSPDFAVQSGIRIHGYSWRYHNITPKHSFRLEFSPEHGPSKLDYPLFPDSPVDRFDSIVLRAQGSRSWSDFRDPQQSQYIRDAFARDTARDMGKIDGHATFVHLYLNGLYWGLYNPVERPDAEMGEEYFGGTDEDYDALNRRTWVNEAIDGDLIRYNEMIALAQGGLTSAAAYTQMQSYLDMENFVDFFLLNQYVTNYDGLQGFDGNNQRAIGSRVGDPKFRFFVWDMEYSLHYADDFINVDYTPPPASASTVYAALRQNPEFRLYFADRAHKYLFNDGALTAEKAAARWETRANEIYTAVIGESARWGDAKRTTPYTRDVEWQAERNRLLTEFFPYRTDVLIGQLRDANLYPSIDAPAFNQHGGQVAPGFQLNISAPVGTIYYTIDGSDPSDPGAVIYSGPITLADNTLVKSRALSGGEWSALNEASFITHQPAGAGNFAITELNYHPYDRTPDEIAAGFLDDDDFEFVELMNVGPISIDLTGVRFTDGIDFDFTGGPITRLDPGQFVLLVNNTDALAYRYGSVADVAGQYTGQLGNGGEQLVLLDTFDQTIQGFTYGDSNDAGWPNRADGNGSTLEVIDPAGDPSDPNNWRSSSEYLGTPGSQGSEPYHGVVVNEVLSHTAYPSVDAIELYNPTDTDVVLDGWWLSDDSDDFFKFQIPAGTTIPAYGYVTFYEGHYEDQTLVVEGQTEFGGTGTKNFALNGSRGDDVWLLVDFGAGGSLRFADHVEFGSALQGESFGRWPDGTGELYPMTDFTPNETNSGPRPPQELVISEVMYNPQGDDVPDHLEFIEIYNTAGYPIDLTGWRLRKGFDYDFAPGMMLDAYQPLIIVSFDPADLIKLDTFRIEYGIGAEVLILGNPSDTLSDTGERIQLQRPDNPSPDDPLYVPHVIEDEVDYLNTWEPNTAGLGKSLNRSSRLVWGNDPTSWSAELPTPGDAPLLGTNGVAGRYVVYRNSTYDNEAKGLGDADAIAPDKTPLRPGQQASFANYTSYARGINGIIIDAFGLVNPGAIDPTDFTFKLGNDDTPADWSDAPVPSIDVAPGPGGSNRILLSWADNTITNTWLEVSILVTTNTGLPAADVFYFGHLVGECTGDGKVDAYDVLETRNNPRPFFNPPLLDTVHDFNRDQRVDALDTLIARNNQTWSMTQLDLIDLTISKSTEAALDEDPTATAIEAVHDEVLRETGEHTGLGQEYILGKLTWLHEFRYSNKKDHSTRKGDLATETVDRLLARMSD